MTIYKMKQLYFEEINSNDLELLLEFILNKSKEFIFANPNHKVSLFQQAKFKYYLHQLKNNKPIDYIIGRKEFYGLDFKINKHTLIPRPETEQIIDLVSEIIFVENAFLQNKTFTIVDIGTGSGNIIISLAKKLSYLIIQQSQQLSKSPIGTTRRQLIQRTERYNEVSTDATSSTTPRLRGIDSEIQQSISSSYYASDISKRALKIAKVNALYHKVGVKFTQGSLLEPFKKLLTARTTQPVISGCCGNVSASCSILSSQDVRNKILLITANLPYLSKKIYNNTAQKIRKYEPITALLSGEDGLNHYRKLLQQLQGIRASKDFSFHKTYLLLEISPEQKALITEEIKQIFPFAKITPYKDLARKWRIIKIEISNY